jgi:hypothetical protein
VPTTIRAAGCGCGLQILRSPPGWWCRRPVRGTSRCGRLSGRRRFGGRQSARLELRPARGVRRPPSACSRSDVASITRGGWAGRHRDGGQGPRARPRRAPRATHVRPAHRTRGAWATAPRNTSTLSSHAPDSARRYDTWPAWSATRQRARAHRGRGRHPGRGGSADVPGRVRRLDRPCLGHVARPWPQSTGHRRRGCCLCQGLNQRSSKASTPERSVSSRR